MLQWACASIGAILVTLNPAYRLNEFVRRFSFSVDCLSARLISFHIGLHADSSRCLSSLCRAEHPHVSLHPNALFCVSITSHCNARRNPRRTPSRSQTPRRVRRCCGEPFWKQGPQYERTRGLAGDQSDGRLPRDYAVGRERSGINGDRRVRQITRRR